MDVLTPEQRQRNMSRIRGANTKPELLIRKALHAAGLRYRLHQSNLPGTPDLVFSKHHTIVFVHGCFWHAHDCHLAVMPATRTDFWQTKITSNAARDERVITALRDMGWRVGIVWECALRGSTRQDLGALTKAVIKFIRGNGTKTCAFKGAREHAGRL